jgi:hypothetical protein
MSLSVEIPPATRPSEAPAAVEPKWLGLGGVGSTESDIGQIVEIVRQLRQEGGPNLVEGADVGLAVSGGGWMGDDYAACFATLLVRT